MESCFTNLPNDLNGLLQYSITPYGQDDLYFNNIGELLSDIENVISWQSCLNKINISVEIGLKQPVLVGDIEVDLFYHGHLSLTDSGGWIIYSWYQSSPKVHISLRDKTQAEDMLSIHNNFHEAMKDQIEKNTG